MFQDTREVINHYQEEKGTSFEPCGTPANVFLVSEKALLKETFCDLLHKYDLNQRRAFQNNQQHVAKKDVDLY